MPEAHITRAGNNILVGKLSGGELRFLHVLFEPAVATTQQLGQILGFPPPASYASFFDFSDGATLFDGTLAVYGVAGWRDRAIAPENIRPISLKEQLDIQRERDPFAEWLGVGALAAATKSYDLVMNRDGRTALSASDGRRRECRTFLEMLLLLIQILVQHSGPTGLHDPSAEKLEDEIERFLSRSTQ